MPPPPMQRLESAKICTVPAIKLVKFPVKKLLLRKVCFKTHRNAQGSEIRSFLISTNFFGRHVLRSLRSKLLVQQTDSASGGQERPVTEVRNNLRAALMEQHATCDETTNKTGNGQTADCNPGRIHTLCKSLQTSAMSETGKLAQKRIITEIFHSESS